MEKDTRKNEPTDALRDETLENVTGGLQPGNTHMKQPNAGPQIITDEMPADAEMVINHNLDGAVHGCNG